MNLELVSHNDPILKTPAQRFNFDNPPFDPMEFSIELIKKMKEHRGLGLAAPQVGYPYQIFAMIGETPIVAFNPKIVEVSSETIKMEESCLSYPKLIVKIKRPRMIKVRFAFPDGYIKTHTFDGMTARVFLHEYDHLIGKCHLDRAESLDKERAKKDWKKLQRMRKAVDKFVTL